VREMIFSYLTIYTVCSRLEYYQLLNKITWLLTCWIHIKLPICQIRYWQYSQLPSFSNAFFSSLHSIATIV
jgi:hypothetical protein